MSESAHKVIRDPKYGYRRLDPLPTNPELSSFYQSRYYDLIRKGGRAPEIRRLMTEGAEREDELAWLEKTLYSDIATHLDEHAPGKRVLDIGCGTGDLLVSLQKSGFEPFGVEPSEEAAVIAGERGLTVSACDLEEFAKRHAASDDGGYDAAVFVNVMEHVPQPDAIIEQVKSVLSPGGILVIRVPNDFNDLQLAAQAKLDCEPWWIAAPDHVNYWDFESLESFLSGFGFDTVAKTCDFPMELFLLMGIDYAKDPSLGPQCHKQRVELENALPPDVRRRLYGALAATGMGRNSLTFSKLR